ncbi:hypothetical protein WA026_000414 [Henosepilachna vigintioctopunctata]|uniref:Uncharacterized protein n=1 Tax=Henosepilachna vigintioctopunctata TaxID=420089 RepID=A0AAW1V4V9_9CUCU
MKFMIFVLMIITQTSYSQEITEGQENATKQKSNQTEVTKKSNPLDNLLGIANAILRGDYIATLTIIVEMIQKQDTNLVEKIILIFFHRFLTLIQPLFYVLFPSTKDQGSITNNLRNRLKVTFGLVRMFLKSGS